MQALWKICFPEDDEGFICRFFENIPVNTGFVACKGDVLAMLFLLPAQVLFTEAAIPVRYLYAGCTHPEHRRQGLYPALMTFAAEQAASEGAKAIYLHPADDSLADYYRRLGYRDGIGSWQCSGEAASSFTEVTPEEYVTGRQAYFPGNMPVWRLDTPYERLFLQEMVADGWLPGQFSEGCALLSPDYTVLYDCLTKAPGIIDSARWNNTAQWIPIGDLPLPELAEQPGYTAFLGDI
ncbi:MAG: GNAT family N-acetyltransferase [Clostridia bacterium]|nr:GNAT family N-acetyltransferase [Clostridia bacterium]